MCFICYFRGVIVKKPTWYLQSVNYSSDIAALAITLFTLRVSFGFLPKGGAKWDCIDYWGGKYVSRCKASGKLGGLGAFSLGNFDFVRCNLVESQTVSHKHNLPYIVPLIKAFIIDLHVKQNSQHIQEGGEQMQMPPPPQRKKTLTPVYTIYPTSLLRPYQTATCCDLLFIRASSAD